MNKSNNKENKNKNKDKKQCLLYSSIPAPPAISWGALKHLNSKMGLLNSSVSSVSIKFTHKELTTGNVFSYNFQCSRFWIFDFFLQDLQFVMRRPGEKILGRPLISGRLQKSLIFSVIEFNNSPWIGKYLIETIEFNNVFSTNQPCGAVLSHLGSPLTNFW